MKLATILKHGTDIVIRLRYDKKYVQGHVVETLEKAAWEIEKQRTEIERLNKIINDFEFSMIVKTKK